MSKDGSGGCCGGETEQIVYRTSPLETAITDAMAKLGLEDQEGQVQMWNAIENEDYKIMIVHKGVLKAAGFTDAGLMFHNDNAEEKDDEIK